jgi:hypothetical protein
MSDVEFRRKMVAQFAVLLSALKEAYFNFRKGPFTPESTHTFECSIETIVREFARSFMQWSFGSLESETTEAMPPTIFYRDDSYRRLPDKTWHSNILTRFGDIALERTVYRRGSRGKVIAPLEKILGIECGATPGARDFIGQQVAVAGASQERCVEAVAERTGTRIGHEKLRNISALLAESMEPHREVCQLVQLQEWIDEAATKGKNIVLSVSRDGVSLGMAPFANFEMASVATLSVYSEGKRMGTVYIAAAPEENQATLTQRLTSLLTGIIRARITKLARIVYVTDAGKVETAYWKNVLRKLYVDGQRIKIERILDYYHASERLTVIADSLKLTAQQRSEWLSRMRKLLLEPGGWGRMMRSIATMKERYGVKKSKSKQFAEAKRYLHRYKKFMNYAEQRDRGCPIGSGIVESACKQIVSERMKLSGMRWKHPGAQHVMTLRSILLSQTWQPTYRCTLLAFSPVITLCL